MSCPKKKQLLQGINKLRTSKNTLFWRILGLGQAPGTWIGHVNVGRPMSVMQPLEHGLPFAGSFYFALAFKGVDFTGQIFSFFWNLNKSFLSSYIPHLILSYRVSCLILSYAILSYCISMCFGVRPRL